MTRRGVAVLAVAAILGTGAAVASRPFVPCAVAGDPKIAESLFKSGRQAFGKGEFDSAVSFFRKALEESSELIEACWWRASAQEKAGQKADALASYREYLTLFEGKNSSGASISKEEQRLKGLAEKSVEALAVGEKEFKKLEDAYVASLMTFAKDNFVRDPGVSLKALAALLEVRPDHEEAQKLNEKLGGSTAETGTPVAEKPAVGAPAPATGPFKDVKEWRDLIEGNTFNSKKHIDYAPDAMVVTVTDSMYISDYVDIGASYAYEIEFKTATIHDRGWHVGLAFGTKGTGTPFYAVMCAAGRVTFVHGPEPMEDIAQFDMTPIDTNAWHRLGVIVKPAGMDAYLDGKKVVSWKNTAGAELGGELGLWQQRCTTHVRLLRAGNVE